MYPKQPSPFQDHKISDGAVRASHDPSASEVATFLEICWTDDS